MARMEIDLSEASHNEQHNNQIKLRRYCKRCKINIAASETVFRDINGWGRERLWDTNQLGHKLGLSKENTTNNINSFSYSPLSASETPLKHRDERWWINRQHSRESRDHTVSTLRKEWQQMYPSKMDPQICYSLTTRFWRPGKNDRTVIWKDLVKVVRTLICPTYSHSFYLIK
jgi:hypothetical protein